MLSIKLKKMKKKWNKTYFSSFALIVLLCDTDLVSDVECKQKKKKKIDK